MLSVILTNECLIERDNYIILSGDIVYGSTTNNAILIIHEYHYYYKLNYNVCIYLSEIFFDLLNEWVIIGIAVLGTHKR